MEVGEGLRRAGMERRHRGAQRGSGQQAGSGVQVTAGGQHGKGGALQGLPGSWRGAAAGGQACGVEMGLRQRMGLGSIALAPRPALPWGRGHPPRQQPPHITAGLGPGGEGDPLPTPSSTLWCPAPHRRLPPWPCLGVPAHPTALLPQQASSQEQGPEVQRCSGAGVPG